jgi:hypothetical protein
LGVNGILTTKCGVSAIIARRNVEYFFKIAMCGFQEEVLVENTYESMIFDWGLK